MIALAQIGYVLLGLAFGAGSVYFMILQGKRDVNGLGRKMNEEIKTSQRRHFNTSLALLCICNPEQRDKIARLLKESEK